MQGSHGILLRVGSMLDDALSFTRFWRIVRLFPRAHHDEPLQFIVHALRAGSPMFLMCLSLTPRKFHDDGPEGTVT